MWIYIPYRSDKVCVGEAVVVDVITVGKMRNPDLLIPSGGSAGRKLESDGSNTTIIMQSTSTMCLQICTGTVLFATVTAGAGPGR
jgi:hypothetical protein